MVFYFKKIQERLMTCHLLFYLHFTYQNFCYLYQQTQIQVFKLKKIQKPRYFITSAQKFIYHFFHIFNIKSKSTLQSFLFHFREWFKKNKSMAFYWFTSNFITIGLTVNKQYFLYNKSQFLKPNWSHSSQCLILVNLLLGPQVS